MLPRSTAPPAQMVVVGALSLVVVREVACPSKLPGWFTIDFHLQVGPPLGPLTFSTPPVSTPPQHLRLPRYLTVNLRKLNQKFLSGNRHYTVPFLSSSMASALRAATDRGICTRLPRACMARHGPAHRFADLHIFIAHRRHRCLQGVSKSPVHLLVYRGSMPDQKRDTLWPPHVRCRNERRPARSASKAVERGPSRSSSMTALCHR